MPYCLTAGTVRTNRAWWSFGGSLDRPQKSQVSQHANVAKRRRGDSGTGLQSLATHQYSRRRALRRAMRSVNARLGILAQRHLVTETP